MRRCALSQRLIDDTNEECRSCVFGAALFVGDRHNFVLARINKLIRTAPSGRHNRRCRLRGIPFAFVVMLARAVRLETLPTFSFGQKKSRPDTQERLVS
jgi:hypothetical protein